jgi:signal transduction histidine kinase
MSLNKQLTFGLAISLVVLLGLQWGVISFIFSNLSEKQLTNRLTHDRESLLAGINFDQQGAFSLEPQRVNTVYQRPLSGHYYVITAGDQRQVSRSLWDNNLGIPNLQPGTSATLRANGPEGQLLLVAVQGYRKQQRDVTIAVAEDLTNLNQSLRQFQWLYGAISLVILIGLLLVQRRIVKNSLKPLDVIRDNMLRLESGEISQIESIGPTEIAPLIAEFNRLLSIMSNQSRRSREALGNLAHALKTQLTILNQTVEQSNLHQEKAFKATIDEAIEVMRHIVERELKRARLIGNTLPGKRVNVKEEINLIVKTLQLMHVSKLPIISFNVDDKASYMGDQEDFSELLGNLLDNACKWCTQQVFLTVKVQHGIILIVEDDGPGCELDQLDTLTQRGFRLDESTPGSGLGLSIVHDIVESYGGTLSFDKSIKYGGLQVCVWLPERKTKD